MFAPIEIDTSTPVNAEQVHLFSIDGKRYYMPAEIPGSLSLEVVDRIARDGELSATVWMLREVLGEGYDALRTCKTVKPSEVRQVMTAVRQHVMGAMEEEGKG